MKDLIAELFKFSEEIIEVGNSIQDNRIEEFEKKYNLGMPNDFKIFITKFNGFNLLGNEVYGFDCDEAESIENVYYFEHFEVRIPQYSYLVPFSPDGRGNFYCLDTENQLNENKCPVVFWVSNYEYTVDDTPEIVNINFTEWLRELIFEWVLGDYNYDGSEK
jgi:SMI1-KNR4 cell-wall